MRCSNFCWKALLARSGVQPANMPSSISYSQEYQVSRSVVARGRMVTLLSVNIGVLLPVLREMRGEARMAHRGTARAIRHRVIPQGKETRCREAQAVGYPFIVTPAKQYQHMMLVMQNSP